MAKRKLVAIQILPVAKQDLQEIVDFIAQGSIKYANLEKRLIIEAINRLYYFPELGTPFSYKSVEARQLVFRNYLIIYRFKTEQLIEILTVHHHSRLIANNPAFKDKD
ncbi:type II toxin-antitoxin system RelE/ParE family toxin [Mucilaginibacter sp.]|uniref:type II toxin-antitoxin system RelE/ParE family toxin n=1 Tax=Mucilaginibacter sp. TaxID=1882438 RepID=UPI0028447A5B|nr:type II toxin-antitoxin system RelE/ParE family toxin [Mucilaginibacter sp.]MDR3695679.1 type II toxin-antitoxin system RelE/ParE family toxin [Mucilaginibacter sp.]